MKLAGMWNVMVAILAFAHVVLEMMPLYVVGQIAHVNAAVLLRGLAHMLHHLALGLLALFVAARWLTAGSVVVVAVAVC